MDKKKLDVNNLIIEVTRKCNMACAHCVRGDAQDRDITPNMIGAFLDRVDSISDITFSGGEPTLNIPAMCYTLDYVRSHDIPVYGCYVATNGKTVPTEFLTLMIEWYAYCDQFNGGDDCGIGVALSVDDFHEPIPDANVRLLKGLSFFRPEDKHSDFHTKHMSLINDGRARTLEGYKKREVEFCENPESIWVNKDTITLDSDLEVYITVKGDIVFGCNWSYETMKDHIAGHVYSMDNFIDTLYHMSLDENKNK